MTTAFAVTLRPLGPADAPAVYEAVTESTSELGPWIEWFTPDYSVADAMEWTSVSAERRERGEAFDFAICDGDGRLLGCCGLNPIDRVNRFANVGYWVRTSAAGKGVATTAVRLLAEWCFDNTDLERLEILPSVENLASQRVAIAAGATREGVLESRLLTRGVFHDAVMHSIVRPSGITDGS